MKKLLVILITGLFIVTIASSCSSTSNCTQKKAKYAKKAYKKSPNVWCSKGAFNEW